jgi:multiple sugar transport system substrate-binding protein
MKAAAGGKLLGLPISNGGGNVMFYNKNLFDKFGVPYPKDGLTWDDAYELSKKMTRADQGIQYRGVGMAHSFLLTVNSMSLPNVDPKTNKSVVNSEGWKKLFENYSRFYSINGNGVTESNSTDASDEAAFAKEQRLAAFIWGVYRFKMFPAELNWDMVSVPTMKEAPGLNPQGNPRFLFITSQTKHKDQAFQALSQLLSDEVQLEFSRRGIGSSLNSEPIKAVYGQSLPVFKGKNIKALYHNKQAELSPASSGPINKAVDNEFRKVIEGKKDINTALRDADESVNKLILMEQQK